MRASAAFAYLAYDAAGDMIPRKQFGRPARVFVALRIAPAFLFVVGGLRAIVLRNVVEHKAAALFVLQYAALPAHSFGHKNAAHAGWPDHSGRMELHKFHIDQRCARVIGQGMPSPVYSQLLLVIL